MAGSENQESGNLSKRKAKTEHFEGGPSSWRGEAGEAVEESHSGDEFELAAEDPLMVLGSEIMTMILGKLDMRSVAVARLVSRGWQPLASSDRIWAPKMLLIEGHNSYMHNLFLIFRLNPKYFSASVSREEVLHLGKRIASHGELTANTNARKSVQKCFSLSSLMIQILHSVNQRIRRLVGAVLERWKHVMVSQACQELWLGKAHIPRIAMAQGLSKMVASLLSIRDGNRARITRDDLCDHVWEFHFTESAPEYWRELDPYWRGVGTPMRRYFHPDGSITAESDDKVWGGHESSYTIVTGLLSDGKVREHYVRINRWPKMSVHRNPDWSWVLRNHLYCYTSVPDADAGPGPSHPISLDPIHPDESRE